MKEIQDLLKSLQSELQTSMSKETVMVNITFNSHGYSINIEERTHDSLEREGITMRNLRGVFI